MRYAKTMIKSGNTNSVVRGFSIQVKVLHSNVSKLKQTLGAKSIASLYEIQCIFNYCINMYALTLIMELVKVELI